nr:MAG TPA: hypothetical protein [Caudoviricetes sp.]
MLYDNFELKRVKFIPNGLEVDYNDCMNVDGETVKTFHKVKTPEYPHPDLPNEAGKLRGYIVRLMGLMNFANITYLSDLSKQDKELNKQFQDFFEIQATRVSIREIVRDEEKNTVIIKYEFTGTDLSLFKMQTPKINLEGEILKFEIDMDTDLEGMKHEIFDYLFKGKRAQLSMFGEIAEADDIKDAEDDSEGDSFFDEEDESNVSTE